MEEEEEGGKRPRKDEFRLGGDEEELLEGREFRPPELRPLVLLSLDETLLIMLGAGGTLAALALAFPPLRAERRGYPVASPSRTT